MIDKEMLEALRQLVEPINSRLDKLEEKFAMEINGVKVLLDCDIRRDIGLLAEGHEMILERLPDTTEFEAVEARLSAVEAVMKKHSKDIQSLKKAQ